MANPNPTRLSPAELRRRLLAPPPDAAPATPVVEDHAPPPPRLAPRRPDPTRLGTSSTQPALDLDALATDPQPLNPRLTPLPESRLDAMNFRAPEPAPAVPAPATQFGTTLVPPMNSEADLLRAQNAELHRIIEEMKPLLEEASLAEQRIQDREREFQEILATRDRQLAELSSELENLRAQVASAPAPRQPKSRDELEEWSDELEKESAQIEQSRRRLDEERRQLRDDEASLEKQMRDMEVSMARERAMLARQETELKRLSAEIQHELELLQRGDGTLREQLSKFQRKHQEVLSRTPGSPPAEAPPPPPPPAKPKDSGLFGRLFRGGK